VPAALDEHGLHAVLARLQLAHVLGRSVEVVLHVTPSCVELEVLGLASSRNDHHGDDHHHDHRHQYQKTTNTIGTTIKKNTGGSKASNQSPVKGIVSESMRLLNAASTGQNCNQFGHD
jgi:hypothetical protein